jgi:hypothetical protein
VSQNQAGLRSEKTLSGVARKSSRRYTINSKPSIQIQQPSREKNVLVVGGWIEAQAGGFRCEEDDAGPCKPRMLQLLVGIYALLEVLTYIWQAHRIERIRHVERILIQHALEI